MIHGPLNSIWRLPARNPSFVMYHLSGLITFYSPHQILLHIWIYRDIQPRFLDGTVLTQVLFVHHWNFTRLLKKKGSNCAELLIIQEMSLAKASSSSSQPSKTWYVGSLKCFMENLNTLIEIKILGERKKNIEHTGSDGGNEGPQFWILWLLYLGSRLHILLPNFCR